MHQLEVPGTLGSFSNFTSWFILICFLLSIQISRMMDGNIKTDHSKESSNPDTIIYIDDDNEDDSVPTPPNIFITPPVPVINTSVVESLNRTTVNVTEVLKNPISEFVLSSLRDLITNMRLQTKYITNKKIHNIFSLCYICINKCGETTHFKTSVVQSLFTKVFYRWEGWNPEDPKYNLCLQEKALDLYITLMANMTYICKHLDGCVKQVIYEDIIGIEMTIYCSLKMLKIFFNNEPDKWKSYYNVTMPPDIPATEALEPETIVNWPFVTIKLSLPGFEMIHENKNDYSFKLVNLKRFRALQNLPKRDMFLHKKYSPNCEESASVPSLIAYLCKLKDHLSKDIKLNNKIKYNLCTVLTELQYDISSCVNKITVGCEYNLNFFPYTYHRYLGRPYLQHVPHKTAADQLSIKDENNLNIRLLQIVHPVLSFTLKKFNNYNLAPELFDLYHENTMNNCLIYQCSLCSLDFDSHIAQYEMVNHLVERHGIEPDWICTNCNESYTIKNLSSRRWYHVCTA